VENALVIVNPTDYGLQATEASKVESVFLPMIAKMNELETEFNEVLALPVEPTTIQKAHELRLKYVKVRTGTAEIHKSAKEYYRKGGLFVDAWKNAQAFASQGKEQKLEEIEKHFERLEAARKAKLKDERLVKLQGLCEAPEMYPVQDMSQPAFEQLLSGLTLAKQQKEDAERKAEEDRIAKEKAEAAERERIRAENDRLKAEAKERERLAKEEHDRQEKIIAEERAMAEAEKKASEEKLRKERLAAQARADIERQKQEAALAQEKQRAREAEEKAKAEKKELERRLADTIRCPKCQHEFSISQTKGKP
jgi:hypothetical protein